VKLSIALPTYNGERYLAEQLHSILTQTRQPDEIVIYDDNSTDETTTIAREFKAEHSECIRVYEADENLGVAGNFERAISACTGDLIALSDQDDRWHEAKLKKQIARLKATDARLVTHNSRYLRDGELSEQTLWDDVPCDPAQVTDDPVATLRILFRQNFVQGATMMFDKEIKKHILPIPDSFLYDHWITLVAALTTQIETLERSYLYHRIHESQAHGGSKSLLTNIKTELSRDADMYRQYVDRWDDLRRRLGKIESSTLTINEKIIYRLIQHRQEFDEYRYAMYANNSPRRERVAGFWKAVTCGGYRKYSHPGLSIVDMVRICKKSLLSDTPVNQTERRT